MSTPTVNSGGTQVLIRNEVTGQIEYVEKTDIINNSQAIQKNITQAAHGFSVGQVVASSGSTYVLGIADGIQTAEIFGVVTESASTNQFQVTFAGYVSGLTSASLTLDSLYYLSPDTAGGLTTVQPITGTTISKPILYTHTTDEAMILQHRGIVIASGGTPLNITGATGGLNLGSGLNVFQSLSATTMLFRSITATGSTYAQVINNTIVIGDSGVTTLGNVGAGSGLIYSGTTGTTGLLRSLVAGDGMTITTTGDTIVLISTGNTNAIGVARDGDYTDGIFPFTTTTPTGFAIDDINEFLALLLPIPPSGLDNIESNSTFYDGKLSFGTTNGISGYTAADLITVGNDPVDVNGVFESTGGTRLGIIKFDVNGVINDDVTGNTSGIPFTDNAFAKADEGDLNLELNGTVVNVLNLTTTTGGTTQSSGNTTLSVGAVSYTKFQNGNEYTGGAYRIGTYSVETGAMRKGFNTLRILHDSISPTTATNYLEWIYDPEGTTIVLSGAQFTNLTLNNGQFISGIQYHSGGTVQYDVIGNSVYKNIYSANATAINFPTGDSVNLTTTASTISVTGDTVVLGVSQALPDINTGFSGDPEQGDIHILATLDINSNVLGVSGNSGQIASSIAIDHPFPDEAATGTTLSDTGFLIYRNVQTGDTINEDFTGELNRVISADYTDTGITTYLSISGGSFTWDSTESLFDGASGYTNGLLIFDGKLIHPQATGLSTIYGITGSDFQNTGVLTNAPAGNPTYASATGIREYYRLFKSTNSAIQTDITIDITNTGTDSDFLTDGGTGGTATGDTIKTEFIIIRSGDSIHGWANPFAPAGNPEGMDNQAVSHSGGTTSVTATLSTIPRIALGDYVIIKIRAASGWSNEITNIKITNIE
jgi:hypothetical protein